MLGRRADGLRVVFFLQQHMEGVQMDVAGFELLLLQIVHQRLGGHKDVRFVVVQHFNVDGHVFRRGRFIHDAQIAGQPLKIRLGAGGQADSALGPADHDARLHLSGHVDITQHPFQRRLFDLRIFAGQAQSALGVHPAGDDHADTAAGGLHGLADQVIVKIGVFAGVVLNGVKACRRRVAQAIADIAGKQNRRGFGCFRRCGNCIFPNSHGFFPL